MLRREVLGRPSRAGGFVAAAVIVGIAGAAAVNHIVVRELGESKTSVARYRAKELAVIVQSVGEDGVSNTADDIWSNR